MYSLNECSVCINIDNENEQIHFSQQIVFIKCFDAWQHKFDYTII